MKERQIIVQSLQSIPFRINADEKHLHPVLLGFKAVHQQFEMTQGGRADVGTGGVAKIEKDDFPAEILQSHRFPMMSVEDKISSQIMSYPKALGLGGNEGMTSKHQNHDQHEPSAYPAGNHWRF